MKITNKKVTDTIKQMRAQGGGPKQIYFELVDRGVTNSLGRKLTKATFNFHYYRTINGKKTETKTESVVDNNDILLYLMQAPVNNQIKADLITAWIRSK